MTKRQQFTRRSALKLAAAGVGGLVGLRGARAETFPEETLRVVTHAGPGGGTDITTRMMMLQGRRAFGQDMVIVNKRGGSGAAALAYVDGQERDGYTFMTITQSHIFQIIQRKAPVTIDQLVGLARATEDPTVVTVRAERDIDSLEEVVAASAKSSGGLKWGTTFVGGADHVGIHNFAKQAGGIPYTIVPFKGGGDVVTNLVGGNIDAAILNYAEGESLYASGELKPIVALSRRRIGGLPEVPTAQELGVDAQAATVRGFAVLSGVPEARRSILSDGLLQAMRHSVYQGYLGSGGMAPDSVAGPEDWNAHIDRIFVESETALRELGVI